MAELYRTTREPEQEQSQENPHIKWIEHNSKDILTVDYRELDPALMPPITDEVTTIVNRWPEKVRLLYKIEGADTLNEAIEHFNQAGKEVLPNTEKVAVAGVSGLRAQLFRATSLFNRKAFTLFADEEKALDWLAQ
jgi:hypothetical protein